MDKVDENKICFITCVNDERLYEESVLYLQNLSIPDGMQAELIGVRGADSMAAGYQEAMESSDAKYKIYLHQDIFVINPGALQTVIAIFRKNPTIGIIGLAGAAVLSTDRPVWWESPARCGKVYNRKSMEEIQMDIYGEFSGDFMLAQALDGIFLATQYDVPWRKDLFQDWHFYDISQTQEFIRHGCQAAIIQQDTPWVVHIAGRKNMDKKYWVSMEIFQQHYLTE